MRAILNNLYFKQLLILVSIVCYFIIAYHLDRSNTILLFCLITALFTSYYFLIGNSDINPKQINYLIIVSFLFRGIFMVSIPALSDDFYRFIWDGRLLEKGCNPYAHLPTDVINNSTLAGQANLELFNNMNSPGYFTIYPPVLQGIFFIAAKLSFGSNLGAVIVLRLIILMSELFTCLFLRKLIDLLSLNKNMILWYLMNPLIIIELTGNLHFEAVMILFIVLAIYFLFRYNYYQSSIFLSLAVLTKMIPLIFLPLIIRKVGIKNGILYTALVGVILLLSFAPFINQQLIYNFGSSIELYFQKFEFNACFYILFRWVGYSVTGYNEIAIIGKILPSITLLLIVYLSFKNKNERSNSFLLGNMSTIMMVYFLLALVIHPWYLSTLVLFSSLTNKKAAIVWSGLVYLSYATYAKLPYTENTLLLLLEYGLLFLWMIYARIQLKLT